jgi:hypothetical protein
VTIEIVLRADKTPIAFGPAKQLLELLEIAPDAMPPQVKRCILYQLDDGIDIKDHNISLTDSASVESQIRYSLAARVERIFTAYADIVRARTKESVHLRITAAHHLDGGTLRLFRTVADLCKHWTVSLQPGYPGGVRRSLCSEEIRLLALHTADSLSEDSAQWLIARAQSYLHAGDAWTAAALLTPRARIYGRPTLHQVLAVANVVLAARHFTRRGGGGLGPCRLGHTQRRSRLLAGCCRDCGLLRDPHSNCSRARPGLTR